MNGLLAQAAMAIPEPNSFWNFDIGNIGTWITVVLSVVVASVKLLQKQAANQAVMINRFDNLRADLLDLKEDQTKLDIELTRINREGTQWSQLGVSAERTLADSNLRRLDVLDAAVTSIQPNISELKTNMEWIKKALENRGIHP